MLHIEPNEAVLELCCFEWFQNRDEYAKHLKVSFRAVLFRMVPKHDAENNDAHESFRAVLFRMVPKREVWRKIVPFCFRAVLFRMVPKPDMFNLT